MGEDVKKNDIESFLSIFNYNIHNYANAAEISKIIYQESDHDFYQRFQWRLKDPPPPDNQKFS